ncbi:SDR family oxidoreductase [Anaeroselena agilis]|uniref:SDR family oxidoreductase n=1 Tax=Anaeroselena agilis TaxID=3063788 RepID=A0ABU3P310_9FIRM|nr:SDR family oxidoreductase [Selenomonadales bacterium 4137-cl]
MSPQNSPVQSFPPQHQDRQPGIEAVMNPRPVSMREDYRASGRLQGKVALISGGDSGIGRAVALAFAREGADVAVVYLNEHDDAAETKRGVEQVGKRCLVTAGDVGDEQFCRQVVEQTVKDFGRLDILVNNAAEQHVQPGLESISAEQLERTFKTNIFAYFYLTKASLAHLQNGGTIINTASVTAYQGNEQLIDYSASKGAVVAFTRSLALSLMKQGKDIRVNAVAPGPVWTPLIPSSFPADQVTIFGQDTPMKRAGQPSDISPCYVFLASADSGYMSGQVLHPNGGTIVGS